MTPEELARSLMEDLEETLRDLVGSARLPRVRAVRPPADLAPDSLFVIELRRADGEPLQIELPVPLAAGYLADEEAAVDEWKRWVEELAGRLRSR